MPDETPEQIAAREAAADAAASGGADDDALTKAQQELADARKEAEAAKGEADTAKLAAANTKIESLEGQVTSLDQKAKDAAAAKNADGSKKYDEKYVQKLRDEAAKRRVDLQSERDKLKKIEDERKSETERQNERATTAEQKEATATHKLLQIEVAIAKKLPLELAQRLVGETKEDLEADAEGLLKQVKPATGQSLDGGARGGQQNERPSDMNTWLRKTAGVATR
jgi:hypothetical protein